MPAQYITIFISFKYVCVKLHLYTYVVSDSELYVMSQGVLENEKICMYFLVLIHGPKINPTYYPPPYFQIGTYALSTAHLKNYIFCCLKSCFRRLLTPSNPFVNPTPQQKRAIYKGSPLVFRHFENVVGDNT